MLRSIMGAVCVKMLTKIILILLSCSGALGVVCNPPSSLEITTPGSVEALSGSCLQIPCNFTPVPNEGVSFDTSKSVTGIWIKKDSNFGPHPENVIFNSSLSVSTYPMNITGNLKSKICTTLFYNLSINYTDRYYFRIENAAYRATAVCDPLEITVKDSPWSPSIKISGKQTETELVTITCSAVTPCPHSPPQLTWDLQQATPNIRETNSDGTFTTKIKLNITLTDSHDGKMIKCSAVYPVTGGHKTTENNITLNVTYAPKDTSVWVSPSASLSAGQLVKLSCSSRAKPPVDHFTWIRHSSQGPVTVYEGDTYSFNLTEDGDYYCVASNKLGNESSPNVHLSTNETNPPAGRPWGAIVGAGIGLLIVICVAVFVWRFKSKRQDSNERLGETTEEADTTAEEEGTIHYGEIDFSKLDPKVVPDTEQEETVYSQVQVSKAENNTAQPTEDLNELYANVKKK